jgi:NAD(P)H-dependent flavin oxidoreductase YrpB (nitropropane dioxygenase family)
MTPTNRLCDAYGIEYPIFGFTHSREVTAAVSRAGGIGMYGAAYYDPDRVDEDLTWIAAHTDGRPFGVDVLMPATYEQTDESTLEAMERNLRAKIPSGHRDFVERTLDELQVPQIPPGGERVPVYPLGTSATAARLHIKSALAHGARLLVSALGPPDRAVVEEVHAAGVKVGAMVGSPRHVERLTDLGLDLVIAQGVEAAAHAGEISTMVLIPEIVAMVEPVPVLAAGGIGTGRQFLAARALGAEGIWTGSIWRVAAENQEDSAKVVDRLLSASSTDTVRSRCMTGKPLRQLRSPWNEAWARPDSPDPLPMPLQRMLTADAEQRLAYSDRDDLIVSPIGQVVGQLRQVRPAAEIIQDLVAGYSQAMEALNKSSITGM